MDTTVLTHPSEHGVTGAGYTGSAVPGDYGWYAGTLGRSLCMVTS